MNLGSLIPWRDKTQVDAHPETYSDPFTSFRREVDRMFDDFFRSPGQGLQPWNAGWTAMAPRIDISDSDKELVITALTSMSQSEFYGAGMGFTEVDDRNIMWNLTTAFHQKIVTTVGLQGHDAQTTSTNEWIGMVATFKPAN